ncbi:MAG TPA: PAS domain S-box protein [Phenylobacterium sp.]|nr:PAS domain S-box protein [Phenylobacterium sp.]
MIGFALALTAEALHLVLTGPPSPAGVALHLVALAAVAGVAVWAMAGAAASRRELAETQAQLAELQHAIESQEELIDGAGEAIVVIDDQATIVTFNRAAERIFGYGAAEMIGTSLERLMTEGGRRAHAEYMARTGVTAMVEAAKLRTVHRGVRKRGDVFAFELTMTEWSDAGRRMFTGVLRDVTDRERTADALRDANAHFNQLFEAIGDPLFVYAIGGDGGFVLDSMNSAAEAFTGRSRYAIGGWAPEKLAKDEGRALKRALLECLSSAASTTAEVALLATDGPRTTALTFTPMRNPTGEITRVLVHGRGAQRPAARTKDAA